MSELNNKTILITGGAGSIGSELVAFFLDTYEDLKIIVVDISENNIALLQERVRGKDNCIFLIGNICDHDFVNWIFDEFNIDIVIHCAARKHVPLMQNHVYDLIKVNVEALQDLIQISRNKIEKFLFISTDKAVYPNNYMGMTKRIGELMIQSENQQNPKTHFLSLRFGNVWRSEGSVIPMFKTQWKYHRKIFITDKKATRYFIQKEKIVEYVVNALLQEKGSLLVGDYTEEANILDIGLQFLKEKKITQVENYIQYTGLRDGEKIREQLVYDDEIKLPIAGSSLNIVKSDIEMTNLVEVVKRIIACNIPSKEKEIKRIFNKEASIYFK